MILTITTQDPVPPRVQAKVVSTLNSTSAHKWATSPFVRADETTLVCRIPSGRPGLKSFRAEFSLDGGEIWVPDTVPDAWILIDPPQVYGLRVYVMIPSVCGTVADWTDDLKRIRGMGFNAVHLLPITTLDTSESPYAASNLFDIETRAISQVARRRTAWRSLRSMSPQPRRSRSVCASTLCSTTWA